ncbi:MAG: Ig-like domain-containing protein [Bacilli bacterium]|nr:Ig-like domain-containing protein [Bacilli bacterium]
MNIVKKNFKWIIVGTVIILLAVFSYLFFNNKQVVINEEEEVTEGINFIDNVVNLDIGDIYQLEVNFVPETYTENVIYIVNDESIVSITNDGEIKALKSGNAIVTVITKSGKYTANLEVIVNSEDIVLATPTIAVSNIELEGTRVNLNSGETYQLKYDILPENATDKTIMWETSDARIATVTDTGLVSAKQSGTAVLTIYSMSGVQKSIAIVVNDMEVSLTGLELSPSNLVMSINDTYNMKVSYIPINAINQTTQWASSNSSVVSVNNGLLVANKVGTATITATSNGISKTATVTVQNDIIDITSINLDVASLELKVGKSYQLSVSYLPTNASNSSFSWSTSDGSVATVSSSGLIKALSSGAATITVKSTNGKLSTVKVTVIEDESNQDYSMTVEEVLLNFEYLFLYVGDTKKLRATILPLNADQSVTWYSGDNSILSLDSNGYIKAKKPGKTTVSAMTKNGLVAKCIVTVRYPDITIETAATNMAVGSAITSEEVTLINDHLASYIDEMGTLAEASGTNVLRSKVVAAGFFLAYNPYYKVAYNFSGKDSIGKGWFVKWGNATNDATYPVKGIDCNAFVRWSFYQVFNKDIGTIGRSMRTSDNSGLTVGAIAAVAEPGDVLRKSQALMGGTSGHVAIVYSVDRANGTFSVIHAAGSRVGVTITNYTHSSSRTIFNYLYDMNYIYGS